MNRRWRRSLRWGWSRGMRRSKSTYTADSPTPTPTADPSTPMADPFTPTPTPTADSPTPEGEMCACAGWPGLRCWLGRWERWAGWSSRISRARTEARGGGRGVWLWRARRGSCPRRSSPALERSPQEERLRPGRWPRARMWRRPGATAGDQAPTRPTNASPTSARGMGDRMPTPPSAPGRLDPHQVPILNQLAPGQSAGSLRLPSTTPPALR
jgi:hypothetical protein